MSDTVLLAPFRAWCAEHVGVDKTAFAARLGIDDSYLRRLVMGVQPIDKRDRGQIGTGSYVPMVRISLAAVDRMLTSYGDPGLLWELWPELDGDLEVDTVFCVKCSEDVMPVDGVCPWCETPTGLTLVHGELPERRERPAYRPREPRRRKLGTVRRPRVGGGWRPCPKPDGQASLKRTRPRRGPGSGKPSRMPAEVLRCAFEAFVAVPTIIYARDQVLAAELEHPYSSPDSLYQGVAAGVQAAGDPHTRRRGASPCRRGARASQPSPAEEAGRSFSPSDALLHEAAWRYYYDEWGFERIARLYHPLTSYKTSKTLGRALYAAFRFHGWPRRDRIEATRIASYRHGLAPRKRKQVLGPRAEGDYRKWLKHQRGEVRPRCRGRVASGPRAGERCLRPACHGSTFCQFHGARQATVVAARTEAMRAERDARLVPIAPFTLWLQGRLTETRTQRELARRIGFDNSIVSLWLRGRGRNGTAADPRPRLLRDTVDRALDAWGDGTTFEQLYAMAAAA